MDEKTYKGVDLSGYQANLTDGNTMINAGIKFAILKLTEGTGFRDASFQAHYAMCAKAVIPVGVYVYSHSTTEAGGVAEANYALATLNGKSLKLPIFIDIEGNILDAGKDALMRSALAFGRTIEAAGYSWGVYASLSRFGPLLDADKLREAGAVIWCAAYNNTGPGMTCDIWQKSDSWRIDNYYNNLDADVMYNTALIDNAEIFCIVDIPDKAAQFMEDIAADSSHGYDQSSRWGPDYDCSSLVITAYQQAGVKVKDAGATYTGNMYEAFRSCRFVDVTASVNLANGDGTLRGDVLLNKANHTAMVIGNGKVAYASINELGKVTGGQTGDQTGREIYVRDYYNYPWYCVLRYAGAGTTDYSGSYAGGTSSEQKSRTKCTTSTDELELGCKDEDHKGAVWTMQTMLIARGYDCGKDGADGDFGQNTLEALLKIQKDNNLEADGICGAMTWAKLIGG